MKHGYRILLVEDLEIDAILAEYELKKTLNNFQLKVVDNEADFSEALEKFLPDLVISDYSLPTFDGMSALKILKEVSPLTPLIIFTGSKNEDIAVECMKAGASDYVIKEYVKRLGHSVLSALEHKKVRQQKEEALARMVESERRYRTLYETMSQGVIYHDRSGKVTSFNRSAERILGIPAKQMNGNSITDLFSEMIKEDGSPMMPWEYPAEVSLHTGKQDNSIIAILHPDTQNYVWLKISAIPEFKEGEELPFQVYSTIEDITKLKSLLIEVNEVNKSLEQQVELRTREILELSGLHQSILGNAGLAIVATSSDGFIRLFNPAAERLLGYTAIEVIGEATPLLFYNQEEFAIHVSDLSRHTGKNIRPEHYFNFLVKHYPTYTYECHFVNKYGIMLPVRVTISPYFDQLGHQLGVILIFSDITIEKKAIDELKRSEERLEAMFLNHAAVMLLIRPEDGRIIQANKAAKVFYGYNFSPEENLYIRDINMINPDEIKIHIQQARNSHKNCFIFPHRLSSGEIRIVEVHSSPIKVSGETVLFSIIHDITERRHTEEKLINSERENKAILDAVPDILYKIDNNGVFNFAHYTGVTMSYLPPEHIIGRNIREVFPKDVAKLFMINLQLALETQKVITYEYSLSGNDGVSYFENRIVALSDTNILSIVRDVTQRTKAINALQRSESFLKMMTYNSPLGFLVVDNHTDEIIFHNPKYCEIWGFGNRLKSFNKHATLKSHIDISKNLVENQDGLVQLYEKLSCVDERSEVKETLNLKTNKFISLHSVQIRGSKDEYYGRLFIFEDITEKETIAKSLKDAVEHEKKLNELKSRFVSMASHEFRTPIASILMASETLMAYFDRMTRADMNKQLNKINNNIRFLREVIEKFLDLSKIEMGKIHFNPVSLRVNEFIDQWHMAFTTKHSQQHNLILSTELVHCLIKADKQLMTQVMDNLVSNSMKYSPLNSDVVIQAERVENNVVISIMDQGMGIPDQDLEKMFQPFFRASNAKKIKGTGLGLPLCKEIIELHKGRIWIESKLNIGTKVCFTLPLKKD